MSQLLAGWGYTVVSGASGEDAIDDCQTKDTARRLALLLSDFRLAMAKPRWM